MNAALNLPGAESTLLDWSRDNPSLARQLQDFVSSRIEILKRHKSDAARRGGTDEKARAEEKEIERKYYETMLKALTLALKIDPESTTIRTQATIVDEFFGKFESAYLRVTKLIDETRAGGDRNGGDERIDLLIHRSRIAVRWAAELRAHGDAASTKRALELNEQAASSLAACERKIFNLAVSRELLESVIERVYNFYWILSETWVARGELDRDEGRHAQSRLAYQNAKKAFDHLDAFMHAHYDENQIPPELETLRKRVMDGLLTKSPEAAR